MKSKNSYIIATICIFQMLYASGQQEAQFTQYTDNILYYNPAYAGAREMLNISTLHHQQWAGFSGAPMTTSLQIHSPLKYESVGLGLSLLNDKIGPINQSQINLDFSYSLRFKNKSRLSFGLKGMLNAINGDLSKLYTLDANDEALQTNYQNNLQPNLGAGFYYQSKRWFIGGSVPKILAKNPVSNSSLLAEQNHFYFMTGGYFTPSRMLKIRPSTMVKLTQNAPLAIDGSIAFIFYDKLWLAANYRLNESGGIYAQVQLSKQFKIGYGCDISTTQLARYNFGSHEILLSYDFIYKKRALTSPRYF